MYLWMEKSKSRCCCRFVYSDSFASTLQRARLPNQNPRWRRGHRHFQLPTTTNKEPNFLNISWMSFDASTTFEKFDSCWFANCLGFAWEIIFVLTWFFTWNWHVTMTLFIWRVFLKVEQNVNNETCVFANSFKAYGNFEKWRKWRKNRNLPVL